MRQLQITKPNHHNRCPFCREFLSNIMISHISTFGDHILRKTATCKPCELDFIEIDGKWKTSFLEFDQLDFEIDEELAREIYMFHEYDNTILMQQYGLSREEFNKMILDEWQEFISCKKPNHQLFIWKLNSQHGFALVRDKLVVKTLKMTFSFI